MVAKRLNNQRMTTSARPHPAPKDGGANPSGLARRWRRGALLAGLAALQLGVAARGLALDPTKTLSQYNCRNWTRQNGLPVDKISTVTQTRDGFLWLGTQNGLVRFDGLDFKVFRIALPQVEGQDVRKLVTVRDGTLLFAINHGGFGRFDGHTFSLIGDSRWSQTGMGAVTVLQARDGALWTGAELAVGRWSDADPAGSFFGDTNAGMVTALCEDTAGRVWLGTVEHGLFYWANGKLEAYPDALVNKRIVKALAVDAENQIWVGTQFGLLCYANEHVKEIPPLSADVTALLVDRHGVLWVGTTGSGLARYENGRFVFMRKADGLGSDNIIALYEDAEGSVWVGTRDGLSQLTDVKFPTYSDAHGIGAGSCRAVAAARSGGLWIATDNGVSYFDPESATNFQAETLEPDRYFKLCFESRQGELFAEDGDKTVKVFSDNQLTATLTNSIWISAVGEDAESVLMAMGTENSLFRWQAGKLEPYRYQSAPPPSYYWINNLYTAKDGALWVASKNGLFRLQAGAVQHWSTTNGLSGDNVACLCEDAAGGVWAGLATGMARIKDGQLKNIKPEDGLPDNWIFAIVPDDFGNLWCDSGRGVFRVSLQALNDFVDGKRSQIGCELFDGLEAVKSTARTDQEFSGCKTQDGRIWFPGPWGVVMIDPAHLPTNPVAPPVHIGRVLANGREFVPSEKTLVPPGPGELEIDFSGLSFIAPEKMRFRYQLEGFDDKWVDTKGRRQAFYTNLKPGRYTFRVAAANADGVWNETGDRLRLEFQPRFRQTIGFYALCGGLTLAALASLYVWRIRHLEFKQLALQRARDQLESEVKHRTAELATANASLHHEVEEHRQTAVQLAQRTQRLETEIAERERMQTEVERVHQRLLEISRQAGMAEVATSVLHNVGNVLNSVNVSATLVMDQTQQSKIPYLGKVSALLQEHAGDLADFLTRHPKGRQLPDYLQQLAGQLEREQQAAIAELELLRQNIEHIKDIVAMQQNYAKISGVTESVPAAELVEDALRMNAGAFARSNLELVREYADLPPLQVEKHKVLQILVNLLRNAKQACDASERKDKRVNIKLAPADGGVQIHVRDNGIGIPAENLTRIFSHGFTTRPDGHGFGLHSGALTARELGGSLTVHSDGPGLGAIFTLTLPPQPPRNGHHE
jgi:ligand-binding sensor domain-containing protein/signal transduction histidine kinase